MEKMLAVVFDNEKNVYEATRALAELDREGSISIYAESVIQKNADATITVKQVEGDFPIRSIAGTAIGSLIGILGGPIGFGIGAAVGTGAGMLSDIYVAGVNTDFLAEASAKLAPGKFALLADISEEWVTPLDTRMEALGGFVIRTPREQFEAEQWERDAAALKAEIAQMHSEYSHAHAEHKAKLQAKIDHLSAKLQQKLNHAEQRLDEINTQTDAKIKALQQKATKTHGEVKAAINARISEIKAKHEQHSAKLRHATAGALRKAAAKVEKAS